MKQITGALWGGVLLLASLGTAFGQGTDPAASGAASTTTGTQSSTEAQQKPATPAQTQTQTETQAQGVTSLESRADANAALNAVRDRAKRAPSKTREAVEKKLAEISKEIDAEADAKGHAVVADRVAAEFGMTSEALMAEQSALSAGWGELVIGHTLLANAKTELTMEQLYSLHRSGFGWGQIAHGLSLRLGEVTAAVRSESKVATGLSKPDGKAAMIHSSGRVGASTKTSANAGKTSVGASSGVGVGVKVGK